MTFAALLREIDHMVILPDARALSEVIAIRDRLEAKIAVAVGEFDQLGLFDETGATSTKAWLRDEGLAGGAAHRLAETGRRMRQLPAVARAWVGGQLSGGQVEAVVRNLVDRHIDLFREGADGLVPTLVGLSVDETNRVMSTWRQHADALADDRPPDPELSLNHSKTFGGRYVTSGGFDDDSGSVIAAALQAADSGETSTAAGRRRAEALVDICKFFLDHHARELTPRQRPHVSLILDVNDRTRGEEPHDGAVFGEDVVSRYLCDCRLERVMAAKVAAAVSRVLDLGRSTANVSPAQRSALVARDRQCRYPGCDRPASWCDAHHVWWWSRGGPTRLDNLVLLCRRHHTLIHRDERIEVELLAGATLVVKLATGLTRTSRPPGSLPLVA